MDFDSDGVFKIVLALPAIVSFFVFYSFKKLRIKKA